MSKVPVETLSAALDEIYHLRAGAAFEAQIIEEVLGYRTLPAIVRQELESTMVRLRGAARGEYRAAWHVGTGIDRQAALMSAEARPTLTRASWEAEQF